MNYNVVIVDDHILIAKAIAGVIDHFPKYTVLYEAEHGKALIEKFNNPKNIHPEELEKALDELIAKGFYYPDWAASKVFMNLSADKPAKHNSEIGSFTDRETEFLRYCCSEFTYKEIAGKMNVSTRTVEGYRDILFSKLGFKTRVGLVMYALRSGRAVI